MDQKRLEYLRQVERHADETGWVAPLTQEDKDHFARQTIPAPAQLLKEIDRNPKEEIEKIYPSRDELINDIAKAYKHVILDLYKNGCRNLQLDDCTWGMVVDKNYQDNLKKQNIA